MKALLYYDIATKALTDGTSAWTPQAATFGESLEISLRFNQTLAGAQSQIYPTVSYVKAGIGNVDARPASGKWQLKIGDAPQSAANTTAALDYNAGALELQNAINALTAITIQFGQAVVKTLAGSYLIQFGSGASNVSLALVESQLHPPCYGQVNSWQVAGAWMSELRLCQAPAAYTDSTERVLPDAPFITLIQDGGSDAGFTWNEIQQLTMPPAFIGSYQFKFKGVRSAVLSKSDDADAIATALAVYGNTITVTNPRPTIARIEFGGVDFAGIDQPLLEVDVVDAPEGDLTFNLELDEPALAAMLRTSEEVTLPLEIEIGITDANVNGGIRVEKIRTEVTIQRGVIYAMLAAAAGIDWLRPMAKDYIPFTPDQIIIGQQFYACALGNGAAREFTVDHNLNTDAIAAVLLRENAADGRILIQGVDYTVVYGGANSLTVNWLGETAPASTALALVITAAGPIAAFQAHTHTIAQIVGLDTVLEQVDARLTALEAYIPNATITSSSAGGTLSITIPTAANVLFYNPSKLDLTALPVRAPYLLPAVHTADVAALPSPLPDPASNTVWSASSRQLIPGSGGRIPASYVDAGGFVASDGRILYPASQADGTLSYYPAPFEQTLFEFPINDLQLLAGRTLTVEFGLALQLLLANCEAQWVLLLEYGTPADQTDPSPEGLNLQTINWATTPILRQRLYVTPLLVTGSFGCQIIRSATAITANQMRYGAYSVADSAPPTANFVLRARLAEFDTKNNVPNATGWLYYALGDQTAITSNATATIA